ncbi:MAG: xanthine dehydrogenase family protein molybdopterin-binding subunit [Burkholderiales bacterium]|nr:xanthine dehydrogenase family protein molybdopterin-binding subunit [Burkholderiales bacterium]
MKRRTFLSAAAGLSVSFLAGCALPVIPRRPAPSAAGAHAWIRHHEGRYALYLPRVEMGQNIATAMKQVACAELGAAWDRVNVILPATSDIGPVRATVGSESVRDFAVPLAQACATLRDALAAGRTEGHIDARPYPLEALRAFRADAGAAAGPPALVQGEAIVRGEALYVADVRRPGMVFGRVLRAPASPELAARPLGYDAAAARAEPGFVALVRDPLLRQGRSEGVGIVARTPGALDRIESALAVRWHVDGGFTQATIDAALDLAPRLARGALAKTVRRGCIDRAARWDVDLAIDVPLAAHGAIEPRAAVAEFGSDGRLQLWVGSQDVFYQRDVMARRLGLENDRIVVTGCRVGGAFGGKTICTVELEAAVLARAAARPVKVQWTRAQEFRFGFHRPPSRHRLRARLEDGRLSQWWHAFSSSHILFTNAVVPPWLQHVTDLIGDDGVARGAALPYRAAAQRTEFDLVRLPVLTGPWRGLGAGPNALAIESAIDECARAANADAVAFRIAQIEEPRLARVLQCAAAAAGWGHKPAPAADRRVGRGVACGTYKGTSHAAVVADVEVDASGRLRVTRLVCAHDCGRVINPDQVRAQCEGNLVWGLGMVIADALPVASSRVAADSFADAPIPRIGDVPPMEILLVDAGDAPSGAGETAIVAAAGAIANAVRDATGHRPTRFPVAAGDLRTLPA